MAYRKIYKQPRGRIRHADYIVLPHVVAQRLLTALPKVCSLEARGG